MKIAINGAGIAGPTLAYWLDRQGHEITLIERAKEFRDGGYLIDFWGPGFETAERMGIRPRLEQNGFQAQGVTWVDADGKNVGGMDAKPIREMVGDRYVSVERSELAAAVREQVEDRVELLRGDSIAGIEERGDKVGVTFEQAAPREFDLVFGADGLHSRVRDLVFAPMERFEKDLGIRVAAVEAKDYSQNEAGQVVAHNEPGRMVFRFGKPDGRSLVLFGYQDRFADTDAPHGNEAIVSELRHAYEGMGWEVPDLLDAAQAAENLYYDRVSQIRMDDWTKGRVALVGDAGFAVSLLAGEGAGLAMSNAYVLAGELGRAGGDHRHAFAEWQRRMRPYVEKKQKGALQVAGSMVPDTQFGITARNLMTRFLPGKLVARLGTGDMTQDLELPNYTGVAGAA